MPTSGTVRRRLLTGACLLALALGGTACSSAPDRAAVPLAASAAVPSTTSTPSASDPAASPSDPTASTSADPGTSGTDAATTPPTTRTTPPSTPRVTPRSTPRATPRTTPRPTPRATPRTTPATTAPTTAPAPGGTVRSARKGATLWAFDGAAAAFADSGASWYYTWSESGVGGVGGEFVPMIWGAASVTPANLAKSKAAGRTLLAFNEPDLRGQAEMTVEQALTLWPQLQATGLRLVSPAVAAGGATPGGWLDRFVGGAAAKGYRLDAIALHWYGGDFSAPNATAQLKQYLTAVHDRYHKPIWLTEYALMRFGPTVTPSAAQQAAFVTSSTAMLESLPFVERYAWFSFPTPKEGGLSTGLYSPGGRATAMGEAYRRAGPPAPLP